MHRSPWQDVTRKNLLPHLLGCGDVHTILTDPDATVSFNGEELDASSLEDLHRLQRELGFQLHAGEYWYDARSGATGRAGGPTAGFLPSGLRLGGAMSPRCSDGHTELYLNGRELHEVDRRGLERLLGPIPCGRYWMDDTGHIGLDGQPAAYDLPESAPIARSA